MLELIILAVIPLILDAFLTTACNLITDAQCYKCADSQSDTDCQAAAQAAGNDQCFYRQADFDAVCVDFRNKLNVVVAVFFISGVLSVRGKKTKFKFIDL